MGLCFCRETGLKLNLVGEINAPAGLFIWQNVRFAKTPVLKLNLADGINLSRDLFTIMRLCSPPKTGFKTKPRLWSKFVGGFLSLAGFIFLPKNGEI